MTMEDELNFVECFSAYVFRPGVLPGPLQIVWDALVKVVLWYCRPPAYSAIDQDAAVKGTAEGAAHGAALTKAFGKAMEEQGFPDDMFTYNLHSVACRLSQQEAARGYTAKDMDVIIERKVGEYKKAVQGRVASKPEITYANDFL